tara:strand:- start:863 stop:1195 length:333 start_codon:yes stop_codon:yes gene_type:complete
MCARARAGCNGNYPGPTISINDIDCEGFFQYSLNGCGGECGSSCAKQCPNKSLNNCGQHCGENCQDCCTVCADLGSEPGGGGQGINPLTGSEELKGNSAFRKLFGKRVEK